MFIVFLIKRNIELVYCIEVQIVIPTKPTNGLVINVLRGISFNKC